MKTILVLIASCLASVAQPALPKLPAVKPSKTTNHVSIAKSHFVDTLAKMPPSPGGKTIPVLRSWVTQPAPAVKPFRPTSVQVMTISRTKPVARFSPAGGGPTPRPMRIVLTDYGETTTICVETVQGEGETLIPEYTLNLTFWDSFLGPIPPDPGGFRNIGICASVPSSDVPRFLAVRVRTP